MAYITAADMEERAGTQALIDLTDRSPFASGRINQPVLTRALEEATSIIDGYIGNRYDLPLENPPALLTDVAYQIAYYKLHTDGAPDKVKTDYTAALKALTDISRGIMVLPNSQGNLPAQDGDTGLQVADRPRDVSPETMKGFI